MNARASSSIPNWAAFISAAFIILMLSICVAYTLGLLGGLMMGGAVFYGLTVVTIFAYLPFAGVLLATREAHRGWRTDNFRASCFGHSLQFAISAFALSPMIFAALES